MSHTPSVSWVIPQKIRPSRWNAEFYRDEYTSLERKIDDSGIPLKQLRTLGKLITGPFGSKLPASLYDTPGGIPLLRVQNIGDLFLNETDMAKIPLDVHQDIIRSKLEPGDIALAKAGRLGALSRIPEHIKECNITQHIVGIKVNKSKINPEFLSAFLLSKYGVYQLQRQGVGTLIKYLGIEETRDAQIPLPDPKIQEYIGAKVELAERCRTEAQSFKTSMNLKISSFMEAPATIELNELAYWTDRFLTPTRLDSIYYQPAFIANKAYLLNRSDIFKLSDNKCCELVTDGDHGNPVYSENGPKYLRVTDFYGFNLQYKNMPNINSAYADKIGSRCIVKEGDVIVSIVGTIGLITVINQKSEGAIASRGVARLVPNKSLNSYYLASYLSSIRGQLQLKQLCVGTVQKGIYLESLNQVLVPIPPKKIQDDIGTDLKRHIWLIDFSFSLSDEAKFNVEALIEGTLDTEAILSGRLQAPAWEDVEHELEEVQS